MIENKQILEMLQQMQTDIKDLKSSQEDFKNNQTETNSKIDKLETSINNKFENLALSINNHFETVNNKLDNLTIETRS